MKKKALNAGRKRIGRHWGPCTRCGHEWDSFRKGKPRCCAQCKSSYWDVKPKERSKAA
jgi:hypothetical protein